MAQREQALGQGEMEMKREELIQRYNDGQWDFRGVSFIGEYLGGANVAGADFTGANFVGADLRAVDFSYADLTGANLALAYLTRTNFLEATLDYANLNYAFMVGVVNLDSVDLEYTSLFNAKWEYRIGELPLPPR